MQGLQWVLDTWVLRVSIEVDSPRGLIAVSFLQEILENHYIAIDSEGSIKEEYKRNIPPRSHVAQWWKQMVLRQNKIFRYSKDISTSHKNNLIKLEFNIKDMPFVNVAHCIPEPKYLVAEERHYSELVKEYLKKEFVISVITLEEALRKIKVVR